MSDELTTANRRRLLGLLGTGLSVGLAGCGGGGGGETATMTATSTSASEGVPAAYETATSIGGVERNPDAVSAQSDVNYQTSPSDGQQCSNCRFYIEDKNDDGMGACAVVAGTIAPDAYCVSYAEYQGN
ncbi:high-potential iron-sulfur protein [Haloplanus sp. C73]|uniref:high-potential iron-sulfur protein n=1 Tax=Haloplanus sp. C73 TaxID=3421641 RepID=UPI003EC02EB2